jgi:hypothetical protein
LVHQSLQPAFSLLNILVHGLKDFATIRLSR